MTLTTFLQVAGGFILLLTALGTFSVMLSKSRNENRLVNLEGANEDLRREIADRERRYELLQRDYQSVTQKAESQSVEIENLRREIIAIGQVVRGEAEFAALGDHIDAHFSKVETAYQQVTPMLKDICEGVGDLKKLLGDQRRVGHP